MAKSPIVPAGATGALVLADGSILWGRGFGRVGAGVGELCFNTAMTGYQEVMTDPSYAGQIITFTFPHIGNVGTNGEDVEADRAHAVGCVVREDVTAPSNFRSIGRFDDWMAANGLVGISGIDTRALTRRIREAGAPTAVVAHAPDGRFDLDELFAMARGWPGLEGMDLAKDVTRAGTGAWHGGVWTLGAGYDDSAPLPPAGGAGGGPVNMPQLSDAPTPNPSRRREGDLIPHVVAIDYGAKRNIFRNLVRAGARVTVVPASTSAADILALSPDGIFLSNGPGDPAATGDYAVPVIRALMDAGLPIFGICLGHQLLALAAGARTVKMHQGHRGANHPVKRLADGVVEITSMNHGFAVDESTLPEGAVVTHTSLFDGSNCGFELPEKRAFSVQYHPEASPGPQDSFYLFERFVGGLV
jgi:carbamoyl-phosphate synthase small subunit